ncbi:MAG: murein biosynthesis integral membrane protein MurJ [Christensenellales bacterium]
MTKNKQAVGMNALRSAMAITVIIIASKVAGFVREMVFAAYFGTGVASDAYTNASTVVNIFILLFSACISSTFIPIFTKTLREKGKRYTNAYTNSILTLFFLIGLLISVLGYFFADRVCELFMPQLIPSAAPGTELYAQQVEKLSMTADMARIMFPSMAFAASTGVFTALLNANERFVPEQLLGFVLSGCIIAACVFFSEQGIYAVAVATAATYFLQLLVILPFLRGIYRFRPSLAPCGGRVKQTFLLALPAIMSMALDELNHLVDKNVGIWLGDGPNTALTYAYRLITLILGVLVVPITTVMFSKLSQYAAEGRKKRILETTKQCLEVLALVVLPVIVLSVVQSPDVIRLLFFRGRFDEYSLALTSDAYMFYVLGVFAFAWRNFLVRVFYSLQDTRSPMLIGAVSVAVNIVLDVALAPVMGVGGLTLATSIAGFVGAFLMLVQLRKKLGRFGFSTTLVQVCKMLFSACIAGAVTILVNGSVQLLTGSLILRLVFATVAGLIVYIALVLLLKVDEVDTLKGIVAARLKRS